MATVTYVFTINHVAKLLSEDPDLFQAIVSNDDYLSYGSISIYDGTDEANTALTDDGIDELRQMLARARRSTEKWNDFVSDPETITRIKAKSPR